MNSEQREVLQGYADSRMGFVPLLESCKAALAEIDRLKAESLDHLRNIGSLRVERDNLKKENDRAATIMRNARVTHEAIVSRQDKELDRMTDEVLKLRNELSDAKVQLEVYETAVDAHSSDDSTIPHKHRHNLNYLNGTIRKQAKELVQRTAEVTGLQSKLCEYKSKLAILVQAPPETLAITELHNRVASLEAKLKDARCMTSLKSGKIWLEVDG